MDQKTLTALKGSIAKWRAIAAGTGVDRGDRNCPLCALFVIGRGACYGCPVQAATQKSYCDGSPYEIWSKLSSEHVELGQNGRIAMSALARRTARAELRFLQSLLPKPKRKATQRKRSRA